jgi:hypothetical protein
MNKNGLLKSIAETGYNVGFGAKKNFATHDIVQKAPGIIGFLSLALGVYALVYEMLTSKGLGATLVISGIASLYVAHYDHNKISYSNEGERLTALFYRLRDLYRDVQAKGDADDLTTCRGRLDALQTEFFSSSQSKQILFSDWYAHYKFFWQHQIEWIDEQKHFSFWRDKVPLSLSFTLALSLLALIAASVTRAL